MSDIQINHIVINDRKRALGDISTLVQSIKEIGLLNPITILPDNSLVAGYHRLEACKQLGWQTIPANVVTLDSLNAELAEIDENLIRNELHWFDRDKQLARRKEIYESLYPQTKHGVSGGISSGETRRGDNRTSEIISFVQDVSNKVKQSPRTVELSIQRANAFTEEQGEILKRAAIPQTDATKLARLEEPKRVAVIEHIATGKAKDIKEAKAVIKQEVAKEEAKAITLPQAIRILHGDFRSAEQEIADESVDLIFTDPPYHEDYLYLWSDLSRLASRVLKPGGILLAYSGQMFLPDVIKNLQQQISLTYCWLFGIEHTGGHIQIWKHNVWNDWKPIIMFSKGKPSEHDWLMDLYRGDKGDKAAHEWSQGEGEAAYFIEKLTKPGQLVVDPMCGSGTILRAAHALKRNSLGIEIDQDRYNVALASMKDLVNE